MTLPVDTESYDYKFNKTLNEDVQLISDEYGEWDIKMVDGDYVNVTKISRAKVKKTTVLLRKTNPELLPNLRTFLPHLPLLFKLCLTR